MFETSGSVQESQYDVLYCDVLQNDQKTLNVLIINKFNNESGNTGNDFGVSKQICHPCDLAER